MAKNIVQTIIEDLLKKGLLGLIGTIVGFAVGGPVGAAVGGTLAEVGPVGGSPKTAAVPVPEERTLTVNVNVNGNTKKLKARDKAELYAAFVDAIEMEKV
jgi:hypothetical protein